MSCFSGCVSGVLGLTGLHGFAFYLFAQLVRREPLLCFVLHDPSLHRYTDKQARASDYIVDVALKDGVRRKAVLPVWAAGGTDKRCYGRGGVIHAVLDVVL